MAMHKHFSTFQYSAVEKTIKFFNPQVKIIPLKRGAGKDQAWIRKLSNFVILFYHSFS